MSKFFGPGQFISSGDSSFIGMFGEIPFQPTIVVPSASPVYVIQNPGLVNTLLRRKYSGYFGDNLSFFATAPLVETTAANISINNIGDYYTMMWTGYIYSPSLKNYVIETTSDDASYVWVGDKALSGWTIENADVNNGGLHGSVAKDTLPKVLRMDSGWYPIRVIFGENNGGDIMSIRLYEYGTESNEYVSLAYNTATAEGFNP